jgi:hypothetical protein
MVMTHNNNIKTYFFPIATERFSSNFSKMHPSLQLDEIKRLIFKSLEPRDLARLARTCKAFFPIATDELWKTIHSFSPLLSCLPLDFQYRHRKLQVEELQRYDFYVKKVQNLLLEGESRAVVVLPPTIPV